MKNNTSSLVHKDLIAEIQRLSTEKQSGTIFITSHDGHLARIVLNNGNISHLVFDSKYIGYDAIQYIHDLKFSRLQFIAGIFETAEEVPLPDTSDIFMTLRGEEYPVDNLSKFNSIIEQIRQELAHNIGPIATIICEEYLEDTGTIATIEHVLTMIETVSLEIPESDARKAFKEKIKIEII